MCGFGAFYGRAASAIEWPAAMARLNAAQSHRGPDGANQLVIDLQNGYSLGLAHQRLAVLDLTDRANQPMKSPSGRQVLCFNGAIYNYRELANELGVSLERSEGDTWVLLNALLRWGDQAISRLNGMWSFAWWDMDSQRLLISRDRLGEKPLYWSIADGRLAITSEIKGVLALSQRRFALNPDTTVRHLCQSLANTDSSTMFAGIEAFPAGSFAWVNLDAPVQAVNPMRYWDRPLVEEWPNHDSLNDNQIADELRELLIESVQLRLRSDVRCGLLLSGGVDSTALLGAAAACQRRLSVVAAVSRDPLSNEAYWIDQASRHFGVEPALVAIDRDPLSMWHELGEASWFNDQPVAGLATVAHRRLMGAARNLGLTVLLSGQGSDEQLGGYNKFLYFYVHDMVRRGDIGGACRLLWMCFANGTVLPEFRLSEAKRYLPSWLLMLSGRAASVIGPALRAARLVDSGASAGYAVREARDIAALSLPMLLHSEDRSSMSFGREIRLPFLDHRVVEILAKTPPRQKVNHGWPKWPLREAMRGLLPSSIAWRRDKKGFNIPEEQWLRHEFRPLIGDMLSSRMQCVDLGLVDEHKFRSLYSRFVDGDSTVSYKDVLNVITLEKWLERYGSFVSGVGDSQARFPT